MDRTEQKKDAQTPVVSPLANEKTYGERVYSRIFDWGLNYWTNLLASAGFSHWAEHSTKPIKLWGMKEAASPRDIQQSLAEVVREYDPFMKRFAKKMIHEKPLEATKAIFERSMERARTLTLLTPGFAIMIPAVWLGAKFKPQIVEWFNRRHYGDDAMDDPSLKARHQALEAETRPSLLGTVIARIGTVFAVQGFAQAFGSEHNLVNKLSEGTNNKFLKEFGINKLTSNIGGSIGGSLPVATREKFNAYTRSKGFQFSEEQLKNGKSGIYNTAAEDLGRFIAADTVYTMVTALLINPFVKILRHIPFMSYKPKVAANSPTFDGEKVKVPANRYADTVPLDEPTRPVPAALDKTAPEETPSSHVSHISNHKTLAANDSRHLAQA